MRLFYVVPFVLFFSSLTVPISASTIQPINIDVDFSNSERLTIQTASSTLSGTRELVSRRDFVDPVTGMAATEWITRQTVFRDFYVRLSYEVTPFSFTLGDELELSFSNLDALIATSRNLRGAGIRNVYLRGTSERSGWNGHGQVRTSTLGGSGEQVESFISGPLNPILIGIVGRQLTGPRRVSPNLNYDHDGISIDSFSSTLTISSTLMPPAPGREWLGDLSAPSIFSVSEIILELEGDTIIIDPLFGETMEWTSEPRISVSTHVNVVPLPASGWFLVISMIVIGLFRRKAQC